MIKEKKEKRRSQLNLDKYLKEIDQESLLSIDDEIELARQARQGNKNALEKLTKANLRFVISVAKLFQYQGLSLSDLINEGNLGLIEAAKRFDETRGVKFISYAVWWIRQSILQALAKQGRLVRLPINQIGKINKAGHTLEDLEKKFGREPSMQEIAERMETTTFEVGDALRMSARHISLEETYETDDGDGETGSLLDVLEGDCFEPPDGFLISESLRVEIEKVLRTLEPREAEVIRLWFGLEGDRPLTLEEIGEYLDLTRERIRQIKEKALRRLRYRSRSEPLRKYLG